MSRKSNKNGKATKNPVDAAGDRAAKAVEETNTARSVVAWICVGIGVGILALGAMAYVTATKADESETEARKAAARKAARREAWLDAQMGEPCAESDATAEPVVDAVFPTTNTDPTAPAA